MPSYSNFRISLDCCPFPKTNLLAFLCIFLSGLNGKMAAQAKSANTPEKWRVEAETKMKAGDFKGAVADWDKAIQLWQPEIEKLKKEHKTLHSAKPEYVEAGIQKMICQYQSNPSGPLTELNQWISLDTADKRLKALSISQSYKTGNKANLCAQLVKLNTEKVAIAQTVQNECMCWNEGLKLFKEGVSKSNLKQTEKAISLFRQALTISPDSAEIWAETGKAYMNLDKKDSALFFLSKAFDLQPQRYKIRWYYGVALSQAGRNQEAFEHLSRAVEKSKGQFEILMARAEVSEKLEQWHAAIFDYKQCEKLKESDGSINFKMAEIYFGKLNDLENGCENYKKALAKGYAEAEEMKNNCNNKKFMQKYRENLPPVKDE